MQRDDPAFALAAAINRRPLFFADGLFGWLHTPNQNQTPGPGTGQVLGTGVGQVAVLCPPIGPEYTRSHRTMRHLADRLAAAGVPALRFDYEGTGDSAGDDEAPGRIDAWRRSIAAAIREARAVTGCQSVGLIGVRLGATLAALESADVDHLVLWNPVVKGRAYARELQAMAMTSGAPQQAEDGTLESAGFRITRETLDAIRAIDLSAHAFGTNTRVLMVERDDLAGDAALLQSADRIAAAGWNEMMADHQFTVVPGAALEGIVGWVVGAGVELGSRPIAPPAAAGMTKRTAAMTNQSAKVASDLTESLAQFGPDHHLFGILTRPTTPTDKPAVLLLNAGSIHHVGPHRLYVRLARELASRGHAVLRFDFEGIGDSVRRQAGQENHPYEITAIADLEAAMAHVTTATGSKRFVLMGICSGAYHVFKGGLELEGVEIERLVAINPWYFEWRAGLSLDTTVNHYETVAAYSSAARDLNRWKRLIRGEVDLMRIARVGATHIARQIKGRLEDARELVAPGTGTRLSRDLRTLEQKRRPLHLFQSDGEPATHILGTEAKAATRRLTRKGMLHIERIRGGDHTFSRHGPRNDLINRVVALLERHSA